VIRRAAATLLALALCVQSGCKGDPKPVPKVPVEPIGPQTGEERPGEGTGSLEEMPLATTSAAGPQHETEPNGDRASASVLPINGAIRGALTRPEEGVEGEPPRGPDHDWFALTLPEGSAQQVRIQLSPEDDTDFVLRWMPQTPVRKKRKRRKGGELAVVDNAGAGGVEVLPPMVLAPGTHYFKVSKAKKRRKRRRRGDAAPPEPFERPYRLSSTVVDPDPRIEQEPNLDRESASVLRPGEAREGYLGWYQDTDWYKLDLADVGPDSIVRIDLTGLPEVKSRLWLTDKRGKSMVKAPEGKVPWDAGLPVTIRDVGIEPKRLPYYVQVRATKGANPHERYSISATVETNDGGREREPNWRPQNATVLTGEQPLEGFIGHPTDWDTYRLDAKEPMVATVVVTGVPGVDLRLEHIDSNHKIVARINEAPAGAPETLPLVAIGPGSAWVRITSKDHTFNVDKSYRIEATLTDARGQELEPNDGFASARRVMLEPGQPVTGLIHPRGDVDYYTLEVSAPTLDERRTLNVGLSGIEGMSLSLQLYDSEQALITRKTGIGGGDSRSITHGFTPGRYYVVVRADGSDAADAEGRYTLEVTE